MFQNAFHLKIFADLSGKTEEGKIGENGKEKKENCERDEKGGIPKSEISTWKKH